MRVFYLFIVSLLLFPLGACKTLDGFGISINIEKKDNDPSYDDIVDIIEKAVDDVKDDSVEKKKITQQQERQKQQELQKQQSELAKSTEIQQLNENDKENSTLQKDQLGLHTVKYTKTFQQE